MVNHTLCTAPRIRSEPVRSNSALNEKASMTQKPLSMREFADIVAHQSECGRQPSEIVAFFITRGWPHASAWRFVNSVLNNYSAQLEYEYDESPRHSFFNWLRGLFLRDE